MKNKIESDDYDKLELKDIIEDIKCSTCKKRLKYINTHFICPEFSPEIIHGKNVCRNWESNEKE